MSQAKAIKEKQVLTSSEQGFEVNLRLLVAREGMTEDEVVDLVFLLERIAKAVDKCVHSLWIAPAGIKVATQLHDALWSQSDREAWREKQR